MYPLSLTHLSPLQGWTLVVATLITTPSSYASLLLSWTTQEQALGTAYVVQLVGQRQTPPTTVAKVGQTPPTTVAKVGQTTPTTVAKVGQTPPTTVAKVSSPLGYSNTVY